MKMNRNMPANRDLIGMARNVVVYFSEMGNPRYDHIADIVDSLIAEVERLDEALIAPTADDLDKAIATIRRHGKRAQIRQTAGLTERLAR